MDEKKTPQPEQAAPETGKPLSEKRKSALLRYMAVLFCAAFILVLISLILQTHSSEAKISEVSPSLAVWALPCWGQSLSKSDKNKTRGGRLSPPLAWRLRFSSFCLRLSTVTQVFMRAIRRCSAQDT